jgi:hypothetical protein
MTFNQQLDGSEQFIIHRIDGKWVVGGVNDVFYPQSPNEFLRIIEDRYPLNEDTLPILIDELKNLVDN